MHHRARLPPSASIFFSSACLSYFFTPASHSRGGLTPLSLSVILLSFFFLLDEFNSCRHSVRGRTFNLPRLLPTSGSIRISISMHRHPRKHSFSSFQYHAPPASFLFVATGWIPACDSNHGWRTRCRINLFRPTVRVAAGSWELSSEHEDSYGSLNSSPFNFSWYHNNKMKTVLFRM